MSLSRRPLSNWVESQRPLLQFGSRADDATTTSCMNVPGTIMTPPRSSVAGNWSKLNYLMKSAYKADPLLRFFISKRVLSKQTKKWILLQKIPKKLSKIWYPANTDIAPESSKREGYFSGRPKFKFQTTGRQNDVCHTLLSTDKNLQKSVTGGRADKLDLHTRTERAQAQLSCPHTHCPATKQWWLFYWDHGRKEEEGIP